MKKIINKLIRISFRSFKNIEKQGNSSGWIYRNKCQSAFQHFCFLYDSKIISGCLLRTKKCSLYKVFLCNVAMSNCFICKENRREKMFLWATDVLTEQHPLLCSEWNATIYATGMGTFSACDIFSRFQMIILPYVTLVNIFNKSKKLESVFYVEMQTERCYKFIWLKDFCQK